MKEKKRIIFVDDEEAIIRSYQRAFFDREDEWDMAFAFSAKEAIALMEKETFDVLVTDIRMPEMDGIELLKVVMKRWPEVIRIIVSGQFDEQVVLNSINLVQKYIFKPCEPKDIQDAVEACLVSVKDFDNENVKSNIGDINNLPSLPSIYEELVSLLRQPNVSVDEVGSTISRDISLTAKVIRLVNSAFFGLRRVITAPSEAVIYIGFETVKAIVLSSEVFGSMLAAGIPEDYLNNLWDHSFIVSCFSRAIAQYENLEDLIVDNSFASGVIHDVGRLVFLLKHKNRYMEMLERLNKDDRLDRCTLEKEVFSSTHAEIGAYLLRYWGLPHACIDPVLYHHNPINYMHADLDAVGIVHAADVIYYRLFRKKANGVAPVLCDSFFERLKIQSHISSWENVCRGVLQRKEDLDINI